MRYSKGIRITQENNMELILNNAVNFINTYVIPYIFPYLFPVLAIVFILFFFDNYRTAAAPKKGTLEWIKDRIEPSRFSLEVDRGRMKRGDIIPLLAICFLYAAAALFYLGDTSAPQSFWHATPDSPAVIDLRAEERPATRIAYYTGLYTGSYTLEYSEDGVVYYTLEKTEKSEDGSVKTTVSDMEQKYSNLFSWLFYDLKDARTAVNFLRITAKGNQLELGEIGLFSADGILLDVENLAVSENAAALFDEQELVQAWETVLNSTYFDEIYHARTAYEHVRNVYPYEITHPPLGKLIISIGIQLFGMTPFGWRIMGTLFGIFMLPVMYCLLKMMFKKTNIAVCGTILLAADFMHYTHTRIATVDTYVVFFVLTSYMFMYRYITSGEETPFKKTVLPLFLSGLFFGLACATKWTGIYSGAGLLVLYVVYLAKRGKRFAGQGRKKDFIRFLFATLAVSAVFFLIIPGAIYAASYIPYPIARNGYLSLEKLWDEIKRNQTYMFNYHSGLTEGHSFGSPWFSWPVSARPILYFNSNVPGGRSTLSAFGNPLVWWGGFIALIAVAAAFIKKKKPATLFIIVGFLSQFMPWVFVSRVAFIYHYFPSTIFIILAIAYVFNVIVERSPEMTKRVYLYTGLCALLFIVFYPAISGLPVDYWYHRYVLTWIPGAWVV